MHIESHFAIGWALAHMGGKENRRFRALVVAAAIAPDVDALSLLLGRKLFEQFHHTLCHNFYFSIVASLVCISLCGGGFARRLKILVFTQVAFYTHYFGDYYFSGWPMFYWWPTSHRCYFPTVYYDLTHPINMVFGYLAYSLIIVMAIVFKRTPLEFISPKLDRLVINLFRKKLMQCHICSRPANEHCDVCGLPCCPRHARLTWRINLICKSEHSGSINTLPTIQSPSSPR